MAPSRFSFPPARVSGAPLRAVAALADRRPVALALRMALGAELAIDSLAKLGESARGSLILDPQPLQARPPRSAGNERRAEPPVPSSWPRTSAGYAERYRAARTTPRAVAESALTEARKLAAAARAPAGGPMLAFDDVAALRDADASTRRWAAGTPRGPLDGVPLVVKEETAVAGLPVRVGTIVLPDTPAAADATCVARLRAAGAVILGTTPMTELGLSPLGVNPHRRLPRNPHHQGHVAGGSSTGSAVAVATGLCPLAVGADGGGSIRIPSSLCGVFGIKPTFGRVSRAGDWYRGTMNHLGPIGASVADLAAFLEACDGPDEGDAATRHAPRLEGSLSNALGRGVAGLTIGVVEALWRDAHPDVAQAGRAALAALERAGAKLRPVAIALAEASAPIGYLTIGLEELADMSEARRTRRSAFGPDVLVSFAALSAFSSTDYLDAQRLRTRLREQVRDAFVTVDLLALPAASIPAPPITDDEATSGILDGKSLHGVCRTMMMCNLTGLPASTSPVGRTRDGLPLGLQLVGDAWDEATVLAAMAELERSGAARVEAPTVQTAAPPGW